jgi:hypothetical protein
MTYPAHAATKKRQYSKKYAAGDRALREQLVARCGGEIRKGAVFATHNGIDFRVRMIDQSQKFVLSVVCPFAGWFRITRASGWDRWLASFLPALPLPSRDTRFDHDHCVQTRDLEVTGQVVTNAGCRRTIRELLHAKGHAVTLEGDRVKLHGPRAELGPEPDVDAVLALVEQLATLGKVISDFSRGHELRPEPKHDRFKILSWASLIGLFVVGAASLLIAIQAYALLDADGFLLVALAGGLAAWPVVVFSLMQLVSGRTAPGRLLWPLALLALFTVPLASAGTAYLLNGLLDHEPSTARLEPIVDTRTRMKDKKRRHDVGIEAWWALGETRWFRVTEATYDDVLAAGDWSVTMTLRPGAFGQTWIETLAIIRD